jgi:F-type H+-transporting ATPase subunit b
MLSVLYLFSLSLAKASSEGGESGGLLSPNPGLIFWTVLTFIILVLILKKVAWKPILTALDARETAIRESMEKAEKAKEEAQKILEENKVSNKKYVEEAQKLMAESRADAEKIKEQIIAQSKTEADKIKADAFAEIARKKDEVFDELKGQIADIAIQAAEKIINENLNKDVQSKIVNKFIEELPKN